jgi:hypothetical protein
MEAGSKEAVLSLQVVVVNTHFPANSVIGGNTSKIIKSRTTD